MTNLEKMIIKEIVSTSLFMSRIELEEHRGYDHRNADPDEALRHPDKPVKERAEYVLKKMKELNAPPDAIEIMQNLVSMIQLDVETFMFALDQTLDVV